MWLNWSEGETETERAEGEESTGEERRESYRAMVCWRAQPSQPWNRCTQTYSNIRTYRYTPMAIHCLPVLCSAVLWLWLCCDVLFSQLWVVANTRLSSQLLYNSKPTLSLWSAISQSESPTPVFWLAILFSNTKKIKRKLKTPRVLRKVNKMIIKGQS